MSLKNLIKEDVSLNKDAITHVLNSTTLHDMSGSVVYSKISADRAKEIIELFANDANKSWKVYGFLARLYESAKDIGSSLTYAILCFQSCPNGNKQDAFGLYINTMIGVLDDYISKDEFERAEQQLENTRELLEKNKNYDPNGVFNNILVDLGLRLKDQRKLYEQIKKAEEVINRAVDTQQARFIELIGMFSAILALILGSVNIATKYSAGEALFLISALALVLLVFSISISIIFGTRVSNNKTKIIALVILSVALVANVHFYNKSNRPLDESSKIDTSITNAEDIITTPLVEQSPTEQVEIEP